MFRRTLESHLKAWQSRPGRKPLIVRGARQTGKTTLVRKLGEQFQSFAELNLERDDIKALFPKVGNIRELVRTIEGVTGKRIQEERSLLFLDEIQNSPEAVRSLRFFYEELPNLHVIAAGSLLEVRMKKEGWSFPVGRVEFLYVYPVTFLEFLEALEEKVIIEILNEASQKKPIPLAVHEKALELLSQYAVVGGMPSAVEAFRKTGSFLEVKREHETLVTTLKEDFRKYARESETKYLRTIWDQAPYRMGKRIKYSEFGGHPTRAISHAFDILHEAMLIERIRPTSRTQLPLVPKEKAAPKLLGLDIGLSLHSLGITSTQVKEKLLNADVQGGLAETLVGQELLAFHPDDRASLYFWVREEKGAFAELDYLFPWENKLFPIEVKSGKAGSLKSLHQFLFRNKTDLAIRISSGPLNQEKAQVTLPQGGTLHFQLLHVPLYLTYRLTDFII